MRLVAYTALAALTALYVALVATCALLFVSAIETGPGGGWWAPIGAAGLVHLFAAYALLAALAVTAAAAERIVDWLDREEVAMPARK